MTKPLLIIKYIWMACTGIDKTHVALDGYTLV